jgi:hypothetical protein
LKAPVKASLIALGVAVAAPLLAWTGTYLYWHVRILGAIQALQGEAKADRGDPNIVLHDAGCRALPYLVDSLSVSRDREYLLTATYQITLDVTNPGWGHGLLPPETRERLREWVVDREDSPREVERKIETIRRYWRENADKHHQWWRVWSRNCAAGEEES